MRVEHPAPAFKHPLRVGDVRQWTYCPRVVYWRNLVPVGAPETHKMRAGRAEESRLIALEERRGLRRYGVDQGTRRFDVSLWSPFLAVEGVVDMIIDTPAGPIPVDYKMVRFFGEHQRIQVIGYAVLLEQIGGSPVPRGFLYNIESEEVDHIEVSTAAKARFVDTIENIRRMMATESMPDPTPHRRKCEECEYLRFCNDVF